VFLLLATPLLLLQAVLIPPGYSPDEPDHAARAEGLLHGSLLGMRGQGPGMGGSTGIVTGVLSDPAIVAADWAILPGAAKLMTRADLDRLLAVRWAGSASFVPSSVAPYFPAFYLPQAVGMAVVRLAGGPPLAAIYAGRLASVLAYVVVGTLALALVTRGAALVFATLMLPMTLWLAASLNQDGVMVATSCLVVALLTRAEIGVMGARVWAAAGLALILLAKPPYAPLAAMLLLPVRGAGAAGLAGRLALAGAAVLPALVWTALVVRDVSATVPMAAYAAGPLYGGDAGTMFQGTDMAAQLRVLTDPCTRLVWVPLSSAIAQAPGKLRQMVGGLGLLNVGLPGPFYPAWYLALVAALLAAPLSGFSGGGLLGRVRADWVGRGLAVGAVLGCVLLVYLSLYLSWTPVGLDHVEGVQGRYFLPLLPFLMFCLPSGPARPGLAGLLAAPAVVLAAVGLVFLPLLIVGSFYLR
jgi:hypothetical protein